MTRRRPSAKPEKYEYWVKLSRPIIQTVTVQVSATSEEDAIAEAVAASERLPSKAWRGKYDETRYALDVHGVLAVEDCEPGETLENAFAYEHIEYLMLRANTETGEGEVAPQPWLDSCSDLMVADLCGDWIHRLESWQQNGLAAFYDQMDEILAEKHKAQPNVIAFLPHLLARRKKDDNLD